MLNCVASNTNVNPDNYCELKCQFDNCQRIFPFLEDLEIHEVCFHGVVIVTLWVNFVPLMYLGNSQNFIKNTLMI